MSGTFSFPPPPPPPSKTSSQTSIAAPDGQARGSNGQSRGNYQFRGRGRGRGDQSFHSGSDLRCNTEQGSFGQSAQNTFRSNPPDRSSAGHKRKLDVLRGFQSHPPREGPSQVTAPVVPRFGAVSISKDGPTQHSNVPLKPALRNSLGLTPAHADLQSYVSDDDADDSGPGEDLDEEALYSEMGPSLTFEYNGEIVTLKTTSDILKWQEQRRQNWPTDARISHRADERHRNGIERRRLLSDAARQLRDGEKREALRKRAHNTVDQTTRQSLHSPAVPTTAQAEDGTELTKIKRTLAERSAEIESLRVGLRKKQQILDNLRKDVSDDALSERPPSDIKHSQTSSPLSEKIQNKGVDEDDEGSQTSSILSESSVVSSDDDEDEEPQEFSSKHPTQDGPEKPVCRFFLSRTGCRDGVACRFRHDQTQRNASLELNKSRNEVVAKEKKAVSARSNHFGIHGALIEQQRKEEDRLAIKVIQYLGQNGFFA